MSRIHLSPPDVGETERALLLDAFDSGWLAPLGPHVDALEAELAVRAGVGHAAALSSGTAALHLALHLLDIGPRHDVLVPTLTFVATANAVAYTGARPVLIDAEATSWNIDPDLVADELASRGPGDRPVGAVISVDLYGQCADHDRLQAVCDQHGIPLVEDAAEALGATYRGRPAGSLGRFGVLSFNGNKLITTSGGGALVGDDGEAIARARSLGSQAREPAPHYEHHEVGFNYRLSNLLAAVGRGQLQRLDDMLVLRRATFEHYRSLLGAEPGFAMMPTASWGVPNRWLSVITIDPEGTGTTPERARSALEALDIEARPTWKPMHLQPLLADAPVRGGAVSEHVFAVGLCLPSGNRLTGEQRELIAETILGTRR